MDTSENLTKTLTEASTKNNKAPEILNDNFSEIMEDRGVIASYLLSPLYKTTNPENTSQFRLAKDFYSNGVNDILIHNSKPITLHNSFLTFHDADKVFELKGDLSKMITNKNYIVDLASLSDKKLMYDFAKEMKFDVKTTSNKSTRNRPPIK